MTADHLHRTARPLKGARRTLARPVRSLRLGMLSTYPPTVCGLATFASALERGLRSLGHRVDMIGIDDGTLESPTFGLSVAGVLRQGSRRSALRTAATLNQCDAAIIQHEYGIYGGEDGAEVLEVLRELDVPSVVVLHTVPVRPSPNQASILIRLCAMADLVVVMTRCAGERLVGQYPVDQSKIVEIAHGALVGEWSDGSGALVGEWSDGSGALVGEWSDGSEAPEWSRSPIPQTEHARLLSWGLLSPGKGVERVIDAIGRLAEQGTTVQYTVAGRTHPKVAARQGETYRASLIERAHERGIAHLVDFDQTYRDPKQLTAFIGTFSAVVMAYDSQDQVTSGVLVDSVAAGRPVIATAFPHAVEVLAGGAGIIVPHRDQQALTDAIETVVMDPERRTSMTRRARQAASCLSWTSIAGQYARACADLAQQRVVASW